MRRRAWPLTLTIPSRVERARGDQCEHVLQLSPSAPAAWTADITMEKRFVLKIVSLSLVLCKSHQENVETEIHPDAHSEDDDAGGHSAELDAE